MNPVPPDDEEQARARSLFEQCWLGPLCLAFWVLVILAVFHGCSRGAECTLSWNWQGDAISYRVYCGIDLLATADAPATQATITLPDGPCTIAVVAVNANGSSSPATLPLAFVTYQDSLDLLAWRNAPGSHIEYLPGKRFFRTRIETPP